MNVLVTGNQGYIGSVLVGMLVKKGYGVVGYDTNFYEGCELYKPFLPKIQIKKDVRDATVGDFKDIDAVIHLAALSNDPLGELNPKLTEDINLKGTLRVVRMARSAGVNRFIYASSQSMYGISGTDEELDEDLSNKNPITMYAKTKWKAECELKKLANSHFTVVCLRPSTVFGASPSLRCDIVFNNLVASAYVSGKIEVKSDGTPWRPVIHVRDVCYAFISVLKAPKDLVSGESINVGIKNGNYSIRDLAEAAQRCVPGSEIIFTGKHGNDARTYKVSFKKILTKLKHYYKPQWSLDKGGDELVQMFKRVDFSEEQFKGSTCNRLKQIRLLIEEKKLDENLRWTKNPR